ncbi:hypothetical protein PENTCL1PPCAC_12204 [Pristionchus entomophagus]|uniref:UBX domain-containing protein 4 n=1 Tax=Pristionchus entomophagus TaxID=358040 RepID=A0AAV5T8J7_9BILA|nr:hypothetical protein PENTCL1PPCAC_12204 [Pristionchus entomophagus]
MRWFEGDVVGAIAETKRVGALFVVYITGGKDAEEKHMSSLWETVDAERDLPWRTVAIKLAEGSQDAKNFAQIYPVPCFPITYFIDGNGKPTNVVLFNKVETMNGDKFKEALPKLVFPIPGKEAASGLLRVDESTPVAAAPQPTTSTVAVPVAAPVAAAPSTSSAEEIAEKIKRAKELLEKKKAAEEEKKKREELASEMQLREDAKDMHRIVEERRNKELLEAAAARRKDKLESAKERERVKEQIKADKAERESRVRMQQAQQLQQSPSEEGRVIAASQPVASDRCRIQVRFPDGSVALHDFPSADSLASLRQIVAADARVRGSPFRLAQPAPRRIYSEEEMERSFLDLALTPASTLLVLMDSSSSPVSRVASAASAAVQPAYNPMTTLISFMTYIIFTPIQFVLSLVGMGGDRGGEEKKGSNFTITDDPPPPSTSSQNPAAGDSAAIAAGAAARRRHQGRSNIHTLGAQNDSAEQSAEDDPEGNWNGNSTQFL